MVSPQAGHPGARSAGRGAARRAPASRSSRRVQPGQLARGGCQSATGAIAAAPKALRQNAIASAGAAIAAISGADVETAEDADRRAARRSAVGGRRRAPPVEAPRRLHGAHRGSGGSRSLRAPVAAGRDDAIRPERRGRPSPATRAHVPARTGLTRRSSREGRPISTALPRPGRPSRRRRHQAARDEPHPGAERGRAGRRILATRRRRRTSEARGGRRGSHGPRARRWPPRHGRRANAGQRRRVGRRTLPSAPGRTGSDREARSRAADARRGSRATVGPDLARPPTARRSRVDRVRCARGAARRAPPNGRRRPPSCSSPTPHC